MRTDTEQRDQSCSRSASTRLMRACSLSSGATASSRSSITTSAPSDGAFSSMRTLLPGTASSLRWRRVFVGVMPGSRAAVAQLGKSD